MAGPCGSVSTIRGGAGVMNGTTLLGAAGRGILGWIVGCVGVMASQKIAAICDRDSSFLLDNSAKGADGWVFLGLRPIILYL